MAQNPLPKLAGTLLILARKCAAGLTTYATPLGITQITPARECARLSPSLSIGAIFIQ